MATFEEYVGDILAKYLWDEEGGSRTDLSFCSEQYSHLVLGRRKGGGYDLGVKGREPYSSEKESSEKGEGAFGGGDGCGGGANLM